MRRLATFVSFSKRVESWMLNFLPHAPAASYMALASTYAPAIGFSQ